MGTALRLPRRALSFVLGALGVLIVTGVVLLATGQFLPFVSTAASATPLRPLSSVDIEELVAPIALYPDALLAQMLAGSVEPQELLDAGNWLIQNDRLEPADRARAGEELGFRAPIRSLLQFPNVLDMMCSQIDWARQLGEATRANRAAVVDAVQRLRSRAVAQGNLRSTLQQRVLSQPDGNATLVSVRPVAAYIYVPMYDPDVVFTTSSLERIEAPAARMGMPAVLRFVAFAAGVKVKDAFDREYGEGYATADFGAYFGGRLLSREPYRPVYDARLRPAQKYRRSAQYRYAYDAHALGVMNTEYFRRFAGNTNRM